MLTKAIILGKEPNTNRYTIRLPLLESAANPEPFKIDAVSCISDGVLNPYNQGDVVYVEFENNLYDKPVILGKLSLDGLLDVQEADPNASYHMNSLKVNSKVELPKDTTIGNITYKTLEELLNKESPEVSIDNTVGSESISVGSKTLNVVTRDTAQAITGQKTIKDTDLVFQKTGVSGNASWHLEEDVYGQLGVSRTYNGIKSRLINFNGDSIVPESSSSNGTLGSINKKFKHLYLSGLLNPNSSGYGLAIPNTSGYTDGNKTIATLDDIPSVAYPVTDVTLNNVSLV